MQIGKYIGKAFLYWDQNATIDRLLQFWKKLDPSFKAISSMSSQLQRKLLPSDKHFSLMVQAEQAIPSMYYADRYIYWQYFCGIGGCSHH